MKGVDYSKTLARERENFQNTIQKDREYTSKRLSSEEERHQNIQKKQSEVFQKDKARLEKDYQANLESVNEKTADAIENQKNKFHKINSEELDRFTRQREQLRKDFDVKMRDISDSYSRSKEETTEFNENLHKVKDTKYQNNLEHLVKDRDEKIDAFAKKFVGNGEALKNQLNIEKGQLTRSHQDQLQDIYKDEAAKRFQLKDGLQKDLERTKDAYAAEKEMNSDYVKTKVQKVSDNFNKRAEKMTADYSKKNQEFVTAQRDLDYKTNKEHQAEVAGIRQNYETALRNIDIDKRRRDNGSGEFAEVIQRQQGLKDDQVYEDKIKHLKNDLSDARKSYDNRSINERENYKDTLKKESSEAIGRLEKKDKELTAQKIVELARAKEKSSKTLKAQMVSQQADRIRHEEHLMQERNQASGQIKTLKENFNKSLQDLQDRNDRFVSELKNSTLDEKAEFIANSNKQRNEEILELRRNFGKLMDTTVSNYEARLKSVERENISLKQDLDLKVSMVMEEADNQIRLQTEMYNEKRIADQKSAQAIMDVRDKNFQNKVMELSDSFQKKMDNQSQVNELTMKKVVNDYENKLKMKDAQQNKVLAEKQARHSVELKTLKSALEQEKAQIISQYENQMNQLKLSQKQQIDQLNDYKRMS